MTFSNSLEKTTYDDFNLIEREDHDYVIRVVSANGISRDIVYEELFTRNELLAFYKDGKEYPNENLLEALLGGRKRYGLEHIRQTLAAILVDEDVDFTPLNGVGGYVCRRYDKGAKGLEVDPAGEIETDIRNSLFGKPLAPTIGWESFLNGPDGAGWVLGFPGQRGYEIASARWNDLIAIETIVKTFLNPEECLIHLALINPQGAMELTKNEHARQQSLEAMDLIRGTTAPEKTAFEPRFRSIVHHDLWAASPWNALSITNIGMRTSGRTYYTLMEPYSLTNRIGLSVTLRTPKKPEYEELALEAWNKMKRTTEGAGYPFIDVSNTETSLGENTKEIRVRVATIPITLELYETMYDHCFKETEDNCRR